MLATAVVLAACRNPPEPTQEPTALNGAICWFGYVNGRVRTAFIAARLPFGTHLNPVRNPLKYEEALYGSMTLGAHPVFYYNTK